MVARQTGESLHDHSHIVMEARILRGLEVFFPAGHACPSRLLSQRTIRPHRQLRLRRSSRLCSLHAELCLRLDVIDGWLTFAWLQIWNGTPGYQAEFYGQKQQTLRLRRWWSESDKYQLHVDWRLSTTKLLQKDIN